MNRQSSRNFGWSIRFRDPPAWCTPLRRRYPAESLISMATWSTSGRVSRLLIACHVGVRPDRRFRDFVYTFDGLAPGPYTLDARAYEWDYLTHQYVPGPWTSGGSSLSFVLDAPAVQEVVSFELLSDTGPVAGTTANPTLSGFRRRRRPLRSADHCHRSG